MKKKIMSLVMAAAVVCSLAACSSSAETTDTDAAEDTTEATEEDTSDAETAAAEDSDQKVWKIVTDTAFKPFEYTDDSGNFVGIDVDILAAIAEDQ